MDAPGGFIVFPRSEFASFLWNEKRRYSRAEAWFDLISQARYSPEAEEVMINGSLITCRQGECVRSIDSWAQRWGWSKSGTARYLKMLEKRYMVRLKNETVTTRITICDYEKYKPSWYAGRNAPGTPVTRGRYADGTQVGPKEVRKKVKESKKNDCPNGQFAQSTGNGASEPPILTIPLVGKNQSHPIYQADIDKWQALFPAVDVCACLKRIDHYFRDERPDKRKTPKGIRKSITQWLAREQDRGGGTFRRPQPVSASNGSGPPDPVRVQFNNLPEPQRERWIGKVLEVMPGLEGAESAVIESLAVKLFSRGEANAG